MKRTIKILPLLVASLVLAATHLQAACNPPYDWDCCTEIKTKECVQTAAFSATSSVPQCVCMPADAASLQICASVDATITQRGRIRHRIQTVPAFSGSTCTYQEQIWYEDENNALQVQWTVSGPSFSTNGSGPVACVTVTNRGTYVFRFTVSVTGECIPPPKTVETTVTVTSIMTETDEWLGIDLYDNGRQADTNTATAVYTQCPGLPAPVFTWTLAGPALCVFSDNLARTIIGPNPVDYQTVGTNCSSTYRGETITVTADPPGCSASTNFTVVKVNLTWLDPLLPESDEETVGGFVQFAEDHSAGWPAGAAVGDCPMGVVQIAVTPTDLPTNEVIELIFDGDAFERSVFVVEDGLYQPAQICYTIGQMPDTFYIHGHTVSTALRDRMFAAQHPPSEARDRIKLTVFDVDLDIDSDNNNAVNPPARSVYEDSIEENGDTANPYGKIVFANHNDDDRDEIPDYSDLEVLASSALGSKDEGQFVPVVLQVRPPFLDWSSAKVKITYDAEPDLPPPAAFNGTDVGNGFKDYRQVKVGAMRLWKVDQPYEVRNASKYVKPDSQYAASWFGLDSGEHKRQLLLEGINKAVNSHITLRVEIPGVLEGTDKIRASVMDPDLGLNCNQNLDNTDGIRVGISDVKWKIDEDDEVVEDQRGTDKRYGVNFWWGRDPGTTITKPGIVDLMPFMINVPPELVAMGFTFYLKIDSSLVRVYKAASPSDERLFFLQDTDTQYHTTPTADAQIALQDTHVLVSGTPAYLPLTAGTNELVFRAVGGSFDDTPVRTALTLMAKEPTGSEYVPADSCVLKFKRSTSFVDMWSSRTHSGEGYLYPLDLQSDGTYRCEETTRYAPASCLSVQTGPEAPWDSGRSKCIVYVHGFKIKEGYLGYDFDGGTAAGEACEVFRRLFWAGHRGNFTAMTWHGDESSPLFAPNVENAFQSAQSLRDLIANKITGLRGVAPENISLWAHSLGNQLASDALRLQQIPGYGSPGDRLVGTYAMVEAAVWQEAYRPRAPIMYGGDSSIVYSETDLLKMSWTFFFNNTQGANPRSSAIKIVNSYNRHDYALWLMIGDDRFIRNGPVGGDGWLRHFDRPNPLFDRLACGSAMPFAVDLAHSAPALLKPGCRRPNYGMHEIRSPAGQVQIPVFQTTAVDAGAFGWFRMAHGDHKGSGHCDFYDVLYDDINYPNDVWVSDFFFSILMDEEEAGASLPQIWPWLKEMKSDGKECFTDKKE